MMRATTKIFTISVCLWLIGCNAATERGNGNVRTEEKSLKPFNEITVTGNFEILLKKSSSPGITITTDENLHPYITVIQQGNRLDISADKTLRSKKAIEMVVKYQDLAAVGSKGTSIIRNNDTIRGDYLRINMGGAGVIDLTVDLKALKVTVAGAGAVRLNGKVTEQNIQMSGAGGLEAYNLISETCRIDISGVGGASIHVKQKLEATVSGVGGISYRGNPEKVISDVSGLGTITKAEDSEEENKEI